MTAKKDEPVTTKADAKVERVETNILHDAREAGKDVPSKAEVMAKAKAAGLDEIPAEPGDAAGSDEVNASKGGDKRSDAQILEDQVDAAIESDAPHPSKTVPRVAHKGEEEPEQSKGPKTREYVVTAGASIAPLGNNKSARLAHGDRARMYRAGEVVHLTAKEARHYIELRRLDPYVPTDEE